MLTKTSLKYILKKLLRCFSCHRVTRKTSQKLFLCFILVGCAQLPSKEGVSMGLGVFNGKLSGCGESPNCVSTSATDEAHKIAEMPLPTGLAPAEVMQKLKVIVESQPRTQIVKISENYLLAEFKSLIFRFVDDVEFYIDPSSPVLQMRSASRVGYSDLGANRKRLKMLIENLEMAVK